MDVVADALVFAVAHLSSREDEAGLDADIDALESLAALLVGASEEEKSALAAAAERAHQAELESDSTDDERVELYGRWMESMLGKGWVGNERA